MLKVVGNSLDYSKFANFMEGLIFNRKQPKLLMMIYVTENVVTVESEIRVFRLIE